MGEERMRLADPTEEPARYLAERRAHLQKLTESASPALANQASIELVRFCDDTTAARAEGARRERERIRALPLTVVLQRLAGEAADNNIGNEWSALLAAITEGE